MGRPRKDVPKTRAIDLHKMVEVLSANGSTQIEIAAILDISERTFRNKMAEDPELRAAWERGQDDWHGLIKSGVKHWVKAQDKTMLIFCAKTQLGWRETNRLEVVDGVEAELKRLAAEDGEDDGE